MLARVFGCLVMGLAVLCYGSDVAMAGSKDAKDKVAKEAKDKDESTKGGIPKGAIAGKMKSVSVKDKMFTIVLENGKDRTFDVDKETKFIGPRGGLSEDGLKDDRLDKGYEVHVLADKSGKLAVEVHLPFRKKVIEKDKKDKKTK